MLQAILQINLAAAYTEKKEYEKAKSLLEAIDPARVRRMKGLHKAVYFANLAYLYFYLDEQGKALQIMEERKKLFAAHQNDNSSGFAVVYGVLTAFTSFIKGDEVLAREQMESVQASFPEADLDRDLAFLAQGM